MANIKNNSENNDKQNKEFAKEQELKSKVYEAMESQLIDSTNKAFEEEGFKPSGKIDKNSQQGWNRGVYGDGSTYGSGIQKGEFNVTVNRVKGPEATNGFFEKNISLGGKRMTVEIHVDVDCESETMDITYQTTEQPFFRGYQDEKGPYMIDDTIHFKLDNMSSFKKELKKCFDKYATREANYFIKTKLGIEDRIEKSINSMVESSMKELTLTDILKSDFNSALDKIVESNKSKEKNAPEVIDANSPGNLLFDDIEEAEEKGGKEYRDYFEAEMKKYGASSPKELKPSEWKSINMGWESKEENIDEVTASAGGAGAGAYLTPGAFSKGGDFDKEMESSPEKKTIKESNSQDRFNETPYSKKNRKRRLRREGTPDGWATVELDADGYAPKGMDKDYAMGLHGVDVNSEEEDELSKGSPKGKAAMKNENLDLNKRKFTSLNENEEKGINKRYIITHKRSEEEEKARFNKLSGFEKNESIRLAESCGCVDIETSSKSVSREQGEVENEKEFMKRNSEVEDGGEVDGRKVVVVTKPMSLSNATYKVFEDDYLNENKAYILDMHTGNLVNNPNFKVK